MKQFLLSIACSLNILAISSAQTVVLDFEAPATSTVFSYFGSSLEGTTTMVIANPDASGINTSANVSNFVKPAGAQTWAGAFSNPNPSVALDFVSSTEICIKVWMDHIGNVALKLENSTNGGANWVRTQANTKVNEWEEICFDVSLPSIEAPLQPADGFIYQTLTLFFDFGTSPATEQTYYFDDVVITEGSTEIVDVTFAVDMSDYEGSFTTVYVSGTFNDWSGDSNPLSDADGDGVWTATYPLETGFYEFKYTLDNWAAQEQFLGGEECTITMGEFTNRKLTVDGPLTLDTVCFNSCYACGQEVTITVNVGTSNIVVSPQGVYIAGGGNFGNPGDFPLTDEDGDGVWSITIKKPLGFTSFYTFTNGNCPDYSCKENIAGQDCANPNNFNDRRMGPITRDTVINTCFGLCTENTDCGMTASPGMVTFRVNMNAYEGDFTQVYLSGSFNNWSGDAQPMSDADNDGIWEATVTLAGGRYEYKFSLDNWANSDNLTPGDSCVITDPSGQFTNRLLDVDGDAVLPVVCFSSCGNCEPSAVTDLADLGLLVKVQPTITSGLLQLTVGPRPLTDATLELYDMTGRRLLQQHYRQLHQTDLDLSDRPTGAYVLLLRGEGAVAVRRVIRQ